MMKKKRYKGKVFVGLSGGVDSSVAAAILQKQGYDVTGVFIKVWSPDWLPCTWKDERRDAMKVAAHLGIPFLTFDFEKEYKDGVVDYMIDEYKDGRVPNPDVMCNKEIKFGAFLNKSINMGADKVATGHYVQIINSNNKGKKSTRLLKGVDDNKDQSYFLWTLKQEQLKNCLFPIGEYKKQDVRKKAKVFGLPTANKKDSQGICFVGKIDMKDFLKHYIKEEKGDVLNGDGETIGHHDGSFFYTIGQRHGFIIDKKSTEDKPYYVVDKDISKNTIVVSNVDKKQSFAKKSIRLTNTSWTSDIPEDKDSYEAKIRYRQDMQKCNIKINNKVVVVEFKETQIVASGQSLVLYDGDECLGGGIIS
jgi:tRNA-specific 2-thiouridylase